MAQRFDLRGTASKSRSVGHFKPLPAPRAPAPPPPPDPEYQAYLLQQQRNLEIQQAQTAYQLGQEAYQTGFNQDGSLNASNPYSQAALLKESYNRSQTGTTNSYAAMGQYNSGARQRMVGENDRQYSIGYNQLSNQTSDAYHQIALGNLSAFANYGAGVNGQDFQSLLRALFPNG